MITKNKGDLNIKEVFEQNHNGFSISFRDMEITEYKTGYSVSITNNKTTLEHIETTLQNVLITLNNLSINEDLKIIGGWKYEGEYYLGASLWINDKEEALRLMRLFNQEAIWDFKEKCEVK